MNHLNSLHASLTDNLSLQTVQTPIRPNKFWLSFKFKMFDILTVFDGTLRLDWFRS